MNAIDFIRGTADYMANHRPDVYDHATAVEELSTAIDGLREDNGPVGFCSFTSFVLIRIVEQDPDGTTSEEFIFSHKATGMFKVSGEEGVWAFTYREDVTDELPYMMDLGLDTDEDD